jgi:hypothetical protein
VIAIVAKHAPPGARPTLGRGRNRALSPTGALEALVATASAVRQSTPRMRAPRYPHSAGPAGRCSLLPSVRQRGTSMAGARGAPTILIDEGGYIFFAAAVTPGDAHTLLGA